ncbi:MAG: prepilin-type N-terminal cleavage/methylation domain-containing protein [Cyanobacteria bacterium]|nr:prepilin-type N-terminal cleavage/methylation domain-containing protein [Cyanobacteria bacterium CG_2015-16_32_12]NCQ42028.1 prepilin-type N-terminal cleavage/methylation domain-containing protein [Cyanobacteria bacterium CG_2015-04_32_10]
MLRHKVMTKIKIVVANMGESKSFFRGITLIELLIAIVVGSIVLTAAASGMINLLTVNNSIESKTIRNAGLVKALAYIQDDIKRAKYITAEKATSGGNCNSLDIDSGDCLVLTYPDNTPLRVGCDGVTPTIYYGFKDISNNKNEIWLKPGILKRKIICTNGSVGNWIVIADGLLGKKEVNLITTLINNPDFCTQDSIKWTGNLTVYGEGGFRFCLQESHNQNRLARIFLYGHIINDKPISLSTIIFTRSQ